MAEARVTLSFFADVKKFQSEIKKVGTSTDQAVRQVEQTASKTSQIAEKAVGAISNAYANMKEQVVAISAATAATLGATSVSIAGMGVSAVKAASNFEQLRARLEGLTGSAEAAGKALEESIGFAASTPFSVEEIVSATATLEAFGQGGVENLELVANIAAGTGQSLEETGLRVAKALAGSSEGFQGLRDTSGITAEKLGQFGATMNGIANVSLATEKDISKARTALKEFAAVQFGGSIEKQSATLAGAFSNLQDATTALLADLGSVLIPVLSSAARALATFINFVREAVSPFKEVAVAVLAATGALSGIGAGVAVAGIAFAGTIAQALLFNKALLLVASGLRKIPVAAAAMAKASAAIEAFAASGTLAGRSIGFVGNAMVALRAKITLVQTAFLSLAKASLAFLATPLGVALGVIAAAGVAAQVAISRMTAETEKLNKVLQETASRSTGVTQGFREAVISLEKVSGVKVDFGADIRANAQQVKQALENISPGETEAKLSALGITSQSLQADLKELGTSSKGIGADLQALRSASQEVSVGLLDTAFSSKETQAALEKVFGDKRIISAAELEAEIARLNDEFNKSQKAITIVQGLADSLGSLPKLLEDATSEAKSLDGFLKFTSAIQDASSLRDALELVDGKLATVRSKLDLAGISGSFFELQKRLADPSTSEAQAKAITEYLNLLQSREALEGRIGKIADDAAKERIEAFELETDRKKVLGDLSLEQEQARIQKQLEMVKKGTREEISLLQGLADIDGQIRQGRVDALKDSLDEQIDAIRNSLADVKIDEGGAEAEAGAIRQAITALEAYGQARKKAFAEAPDELKRYEKELETLQRELRATEKEIPVERFRALSKTLKDSVDSKANTATQLTQTAAALKTLKAAIASGTVDQAQGLELAADLENQILGFVREQTREKERQVNELAALQLQALEQEIALLELRKQAGENVETELQAKRQERLNTELEAIETAKNAEIAAGADVLLAEEKASVKRDLLLGKEVQAEYQAQLEIQKARQGETVPGQAVGPQRSTSRSSSVGSFSSQNTGQKYEFRLGTTGGPADFSEGFGQSFFRREAPPTPQAPNLQRIQASVASRAPIPAESEAKNVNDNRSFTVSINVDGGGDATAQASPELKRIILGVVESKFRTEGYYDGGSGPSL